MIVDWNGDGVVDIATANSFTDDVSILLGTGDGEFVAAGSFGVDCGPTYIVHGDFNHDSIPDLATANLSDSVSVLFGNGNGTIANESRFGLEIATFL